MKKLVLILFVFLVAITGAISGCKKKNIAVKGEGVEITKEDIDKRLKEIEEAQEAQGAGLDKLPKNIVEQVKKQMREQAIESLVREQLLFSGAKAEGVEVTDKEVNDRLEQFKKIFPNEKEFEKQLKAQNQTEAGLKEIIRRQLLMEKLREKLSKGKIKITEAEIKKYYEDNKETFKAPEQVRARHIVVKDSKKAAETLNELKNGGDFAKLAKKYSTDERTKSNGGELGWFPRGTLFPNIPQFDNSVFKLKVNEFSEPIKTTLGYHIVQVLEKKAAVQRSLEESKPIIKTMLKSQKEQELLEKWLEEIEKKANIKYEEAQSQEPKPKK